MTVFLNCDEPMVPEHGFGNHLIVSVCPFTEYSSLTPKQIQGIIGGLEEDYNATFRFMRNRERAEGYAADLLAERLQKKLLEGV